MRTKTKEKFVNKSYKLKEDVAPLSYMLPTRHTKRFPLLWFDEETGENRALRYSRNQKSIFEDEQDGNVILEPIIFEDGLLNVSKTNQPLQKFLALHPLNGTRFVEINKEKDAKKDMEILSVEVDALIEAKKMDIEQLETVGRVLLGDVSRLTTAELKRDMLVYARNYPHDFLNIIKDPQIKLQSTVQEFFDAGLLQRKKQNVHFNLEKNKSRMVTIPTGEDHLAMVAEFLRSDEGIESLKLLEKTLKSKS
tara:strand:- start:134 stop:886 length:753 start_codon:yes stop_codon:yes gene_type:complete